MGERLTLIYPQFQSHNASLANSEMGSSVSEIVWQLLVKFLRILNECFILNVYFYLEKMH